MKDGMHGLSIRLSAADLARLDAIAARFQLDRTKSLRRLIRDAAQAGTLPQHGTFTPLGYGRTCAPVSIRLTPGGR